MQKESDFTKQLFDIEQVISIAQDIVAQVAPEELSSFSALSTLYSKKPENIFNQQVAKDDDLGFGVGEVIQALAPAILLTVQQVFVQVSSDATEKSAATLFRRLGKKVFKHSSSRKRLNQPGSPEYTLADIRDYAYKTACELKISEAKAKLIADALAGRLATKQNERERL